MKWDAQLQQFELNPQERETLQAWSRRGRTNQAMAMRARIILLAAEGVENIDVAGELGLSNQTVCKWRGRFCKSGLSPSEMRLVAGLRDRSRTRTIQAVVDTTLHQTGHALEFPADG